MASVSETFFLQFSTKFSKKCQKKQLEENRKSRNRNPKGLKMPASGLYQHENADEPDIMSWFPRREDYEDKPAFVPDESYEEKIQRLKI